MITQYLLFAGDVVIHMAIIGIFAGVTISFIVAFICLVRWAYEKIRGLR